MSIPRATVTTTGVSVPTTADVKAGLWELLTTAFGSNLTQTENTPQGQLVVTETAVLQDRDAQFVEMVNQFDPQYADGRFQDAIAKLYFLTRKSATYSTAQVTFRGLNGVVIPKGFQVQDSNGYFWSTTEQLIIDVSGTITGTVQCSTAGAVSAAANTITTITVALSGLDRITNNDAAAIGADTEQRTDFEERRSDSVATNSKLTDAATRGAIANLSGVVDVWVKSNYTASDTTFGSTNYPVVAHGVLISVVGGVDADIAWQALVKAGTGAPFVGNTNPTVYDDDTYPDRPVPYTDVKFLRPSNETVYFKIIMADKSTVTPTDETNIKNAVVNALASGSNRARIAQFMTAFQYGDVIRAVTSARMLGIQISTDNKTWVDSIEFGVDQFPVTSAFNVNVVGKGE